MIWLSLLTSSLLGACLNVKVVPEQTQHAGEITSVGWLENPLST